MQEPTPAIFAGTVHVVSEPSIRLHSGAGAHYTPGRGGVQTGGQHISSFIDLRWQRLRCRWVVDTSSHFRFSVK